MAENQAQIGFGVLFKIGDGASPEVFTAVAEIRDVSGPNASRDAAQVTHNESPDRFHEFLPQLWDGGEVSFEMNFTSANSAVLYAELAKNTPTNYRITIPASITKQWDFTGFMTAFEPSYPTEDGMMASATFKVTGKPVLS